MAEPKCPSCAVEGVQHFASKESLEKSRLKDPWFIVVYCDNCGHVYEVLAKHVFTQAASARLVVRD